MAKKLIIELSDEIDSKEITQEIGIALLTRATALYEDTENGDNNKARDLRLIGEDVLNGECSTRDVPEVKVVPLDKMKRITDEMMELIKTEATVEANNYEYRMKEGE